MERSELEGLGREDLIEVARRWGVPRPEVMTRVELMDEVIRLATPNPVERKKARGWLGVARDLVASVVEQGLSLPDAAAFIRGEVRYEALRPPHRPVATVTLAEIYGAQGHLDRAILMLDEVLANEPDHRAARKLRERLARERASRAPSPPLQVETEDEAPASEEPRTIAGGGEPVSEEAPATVLEPLARPRERAPAERLPEELLAAEGPRTEPPSESAPSESAPVQRLPEELLAAEGPRTEPPSESAPSESAPVQRLPEELLAVEGPRTELPPAEPVQRLPEELLAREGPRTEFPPAQRLTEERLATEGPPTEIPPPGEEAPETPRMPPRAPAHPGAVFARADGKVAVYYELGERAPAGPLVLRVVETRPRQGGAVRVEHDLEVAAASGVATVTELEPGSVLRAAIGHRERGTFRALAVAAEVGRSASGIEIVWAPRRSVDYRPIAERAAFWG